MPPVAPPARSRNSFRRALLGGVSLFTVLLVLASCMGDPTGPRPQARFTAPVRFTTSFPELQRNALFASIVTFDRVHVVIKRADGSVAIDTLVDFPSSAQQVTLDLNVTLSPGAPATGEPMMLDLGYLNAQNEVVFHGGAPITVVPALPGAPAPPPVTVPVVYTGTGASATGVRISPRSLSVNAGDPFTFTAVAVDASGTVIPNTPIAWTSLDPARATITDPSAGTGRAQSQRGAARIVAQLLNDKADTVTVNVTLPAAAISAVSGSGQTGKVGKATPALLAQPIVARVTASDGAGVAGASVTFAAQNGGSVNPTIATTDANGNAQATWTLGNSAGAQTATATAAGLAGSPVTFTATGQATVATKLVISSAPSAGASLNSAAPFNVVVSAQDVDGDVVSSFTGTVTLSLTGGTTGAALAGPVTAAAVAGVATFTGVNIVQPGTGYVINAAATGLTGASSGAFNIINGPPASMSIVNGDGQTGGVGTALSPITILVKDGANNPKPGVTVSFSPSAGSVAPVAANTNTSGQVTVVWTLGPTVGPQALTASSNGLPDLVVTATAMTTLNQLAFTQQPPASVTGGSAFAPALAVEVRDGAGAPITTFTGAVTLALGNNPSGGTLAGATSVNAVAGVATFPGLSVNLAGTGYTIVASAAGAANGTSHAFDVVAGPAAVLSLSSGNNQTNAPGTLLAQPIVAKVADLGGNGVAGVTVNFGVSAGGGSVNPASAVTNASGLASTAWTIGTAGAQTLSITSGTLSGSPLTATASLGAGPPVATLLTPHLDTVTAFNDTRVISAQARDAAGNVVAGSWTWVSRNPAVATVNAAGVVTSVTDGSTVIVATEANGSKDSSTVVVQQRIASINVTPGNRSIYTSGNFTFTAQAVDGRGVAMVTQPTFAWSSTVPSVATVNGTTGVATGVTIGNTQVRAQAGSTIGVANLSVLTPITRIDVSFDSTNAPAPDVFTMASLGDTRMYRAVARDTLLNVMTGVSFTWSSTNGSVALIDSTTPTKARALSAANGLTTIQASAQGVTGGATLTVSQVLASIELTPPTAVVGVTGTTSMTARGKDANGRYIPGGSFLFASSVPTVATVGSSTGLVTGVANGSTNITASAGQITSNAAVISVNNSGPALISFGRDTLGIGRSTTTSIPILLSKPNAAPVTVNLAVADTNAFFTTASVTVPAGQTSVNATLTGRNAGTTRVFATDGSGTGFAGDTAVLAVQANLRMTTTFYSVSATDQIATQALLSDPSPAGGTYVTFSYGTAGRALVSPDPAFIPAGQLAADVVIKGLVAGSTTITPSAAGVSGTAATVSVGAAVLNINFTSTLLGQGQSRGMTVNAPNNLNNGLTVTLSSTDTTIARSSSGTAVIPVNGSQASFTAIGVGNGTAKLYATASGWVTDSVSIITTTPRVTLSGGGTLNTTSGPSNFSVSSADSIRTAHPRVSSLTARLSSSDPTVLRVIDTLVTIAPGSQSVSGQVIPGGAVGTARLIVTASGHTPDTTVYTVNGPKINLSYTTNRLGAGQEFQSQQQQYYVQVPNAVAQALNITLTSSDSSIVATQPVVTIPAGSTFLYFTIRGKAPGTATLIASAPGYSPDTGTTIVTSPRVIFSPTSRTMNAFSTSAITVFAADTLRSAHSRTQALAIQIASLDTTIATVDTVSTIAAASANSGNIVITATGVGTTRLVVTAPGHLPDTMTVVVQPAKLNFTFVSTVIGARQTDGANSYGVNIPNSRGVSVPVTLTQKQPGVIALSSTSLVVPANSSGAGFTFNGLVPGRDTIIATAAGYQPDTAVVAVSTPRLRASSITGTAVTTDPPYSVFLYISDSLGTRHTAADTVTIHAVSSDTNVIKPGQAYFRIDKGVSFVQPTIQFVGNGVASITYSDSAGSGYQSWTTNTVSVTGPSLTIGSNFGTTMLGMRQTSFSNEYYVLAPNPVGAALTVNLVSTDPRVVSVPSTVTIPAGNTLAYFTVTANDTIGTIQLQATATGYAVGTRNVQVTQPKFSFNITPTLNSTSPPSSFQVRSQDAIGNNHPVAQDVTVTLQTSAPGVATMDSTTVTILAGQSASTVSTWRPVAVGTAVFSAVDTRATFYKYPTGTVNVSVITPAASTSPTARPLSPGQYFDLYLQVPDIATSAITVPIAHSASPHVNTLPSVVIPAGQNYVYVRVAGSSLGADTITMSPPGHVPVKSVITVGLGRLDPSSWPTTLRAGDSTQVYVYAQDQSRNGNYVVSDLTVSLTANANFQWVSGGSSSAPITSVVIPADQQGLYVWIKGVAPGTASGGLSAPNYSTYSNTFTVTP